MDKPLIFLYRGSPSPYLEADLQAECLDLVIIHGRVFFVHCLVHIGLLIGCCLEEQIISSSPNVVYMLEHALDEPIPGFIITCELGGCQCLMERKLIFFWQAFFSIQGYRERLAPGWCPCGICRRGSHNNWGITNVSASEALSTEEDILWLLLDRYEQNFKYTTDKARTWSKKHLTQVQVGEPSLLEFLTETWMRGYCRDMDDSEAKASTKPPT